MTELKLFGPFTCEPSTGRPLRHGEAIAIGDRGTALLEPLIDADDAVVSKDALGKGARPRLSAAHSTHPRGRSEGFVRENWEAVAILSFAGRLLCFALLGSMFGAALA